MTEELEFSISRYADGTLPGAERAALEKILAADESARALLAEYRRLDGVIRAGLPLPGIRWEALHEHLSESVAASRESSARLKIDARPMWIGPRGWMAVAASVLIVCGIAVELVRRAGKTPGVTQPVAVAVVHGPAIEVATGMPNAVVTLTPPASADAAEIYPEAEGVVYQPSHVTIASAGGVGKGLR